MVQGAINFHWKYKSLLTQKFSHSPHSSVMLLLIPCLKTIWLPFVLKIKSIKGNLKKIKRPIMIWPLPPSQLCFMTPALLSTINTKLSVSRMTKIFPTLDLSYKLLPLSEECSSYPCFWPWLATSRLSRISHSFYSTPQHFVLLPYSTALSFNIWWVCHLS